MNVVGMIPARMGSSRFPGKPITPVLGLPMLEHVYKRCAMAEGLSSLYVATCDEEIKSVVEGFGGKAIMTSDVHVRASDRIAEAAEGMEADVIVMIQGDEPMTQPGMIDAAVQPFIDDPSVLCVNLTKRITDKSEFKNRDCIKVVIDQAGNAMYMSREPIPTLANAPFEEIEAFKQVCIIPFTKESLAQFQALEPTPAEISESVDMMRFIEHGIPVRMVETDFDSYAIDRPEDVARIEELLRNDPLTATYMTQD